jgi:lysophospholipase L1-like esterase
MLAGIGTALIIGEIIARLTWSSPDPERAHAAAAADLPELTTVAELVTPNVRGTFKGKLYRTNSAGFRGREYSASATSGVVRIVIVGDSVTMGEGVLEEEAYPAVLERQLNAGDASPRYEVLNLGLSGLNITADVQRLETLGLGFHPDLVVYGFTLNDIEGSTYHETPMNYAGLAHLQRYFHFTRSRSYLLRVLWPRWMALADTVFPSRGSYAFDLDEVYFHNPPAWAEFTAGLDRLAALAREHHVCAHVFIHTHLFALRFMHPFAKVYDRVADAARERGLTVTQSLPIMRGRDEGALILGPDDLHPNPAGHELFARALLDGLRALPDQCWRR